MVRHVDLVEQQREQQPKLRGIFAQRDGEPEPFLAVVGNSRAACIDAVTRGPSLKSLLPLADKGGPAPDGYSHAELCRWTNAWHADLVRSGDGFGWELRDKIDLRELRRVLWHELSEAERKRLTSGRMQRS